MMAVITKWARQHYVFSVSTCAAPLLSKRLSTCYINAAVAKYSLLNPPEMILKEST
jgi:hypothetical protein